MKTIATLALATLIATPALAAPEVFTIDNGHTFPRFSYSHFGYSTQLSRFNKTTGTVTLDAGTGTVDVVIDMKSVDTGSALFDEHIQGPDFLDTAAHPTATFRSTGVKFDGDKPVTIDGELTIKGLTHPVTLNVTAYHRMPHPMMKKDAIGADATTVIKRSDFGAGKHAPYVGDEVTLTIALEAIKQ